MTTATRSLAQLTVVAALLALSSPAQAAMANLISNGGFESGGFVPNTANPGEMSLTTPSTAISGWVVNNLSGGDIVWEQSAEVSGGNSWGLKSSDGTKFVDLTGYANDSTFPKGGIQLSQAIATVAGQHYILTFDLGSSQTYDGPNNVNPSVLVSVSGMPAVQSFTGNVNSPDIAGFKDHWQHMTFAFTAAGPTTVAFTAFTYPVDHVILLDNVSLTAVPEASTFMAGALLLLPLGVSTLRILRRKSDA